MSELDNDQELQLHSERNLVTIKAALAARASVLGFQQLAVTDTELSAFRPYLKRWLRAGRHGTMQWMKSSYRQRIAPEKLLPGTIRVICCRMNYLPLDDYTPEGDAERAAIARYALGSDYHRLLRRRLAKLARWLAQQTESLRYRAFTDSAPVFERALAYKAGLGWIGKNTMLINRSAGSWFFLGEIFTDLPLPLDSGDSRNYCGACNACLDACPTGAFVAPGQLDARRCIAYLTIENKGAIPVALRKAMGNRIFGCDDCQRVCPWNKKAPLTTEPKFSPRHGLDNADLCELFAWDEQRFERLTRGSPLRRPGYHGWLRNIAVALGNAPHSTAVVAALESRREHPSALVREHVQWALAQHDSRKICNTVVTD